MARRSALVTRWMRYRRRRQIEAEIRQLEGEAAALERTLAYIRALDDQQDQPAGGETQ